MLPKILAFLTALAVLMGAGTVVSAQTPSPQTYTGAYPVSLAADGYPRLGKENAVTGSRNDRSITNQNP